MKRIAETLGSCHPIFRAFPKSVHIFEPVQKLNSHGALDERYLVVATAGVFLLTYSSIKRSYQISRFIPMIELESLEVTRESSTFTGGDVHFTVIHKHHVKFAATAYSVFCAIYSHQNLEVKLSIDKSRKDQFDELFYPLNTESVLAERFMGGIMTNRKAIFEEEAMKYVYESLHNNVTKFEFTDKSNGNPLTYAIVSAIAFGDETTELVVNSLNLHLFFHHLETILRNSYSIKKVTFKGIKFDTVIAGMEDLFNEQVTAPAVEFEFNNCQFENPDLNVIFSSFATFKHEIKSLSFIKCQFCDQMLDSVFQALFFQKCFFLFAICEYLPNLGHMCCDGDLSRPNEKCSCSPNQMLDHIDELLQKRVIVVEAAEVHEGICHDAMPTAMLLRYLAQMLFKRCQNGILCVLQESQTCFPLIDGSAVRNICLELF